LVTFFLLFGAIPRYKKYYFDKAQVVACRFAEEFCANPRNVSTRIAGDHFLT
jgi:hypothetical protein